MTNINVDFKIQIDERKKSTLYKKNFQIYLHPDFLNSEVAKKHNINNHIYWFKEKIKLNQKSEITIAYSKWSINYVDYGINLWTEINGKRPSIMIKKSKYSFGEDIIVIPLSSITINKSKDTFDVCILPHQTSWLKNASFAKIRQMRSISKKRIWNNIWKIIDRALKDQINETIKEMFWI